MATQTTTTAEYLIKFLYSDGLDESALMGANKLLSHVERDRKFTSSKGKVVATPGANGQGGYATNADAYAARAGASGQDFLVPMRKKLHVGELSGDLVRLTEAGGDESQFCNILTRDVDGATENFGQELNQRLYGKTLGERARIHATTAISTVTLTLANPEDAAFFEVDMRVSAVDPATNLLRDSGDFVTIVAIDPILGTLTADAAWSNIASIALGDILIRWGIRNVDFDGLAAWVPETPSASFLGVDQTTNRARFAGVYLDISGYAIRPGFIRAKAVSQNMLGKGFENDPFFMNPVDVSEIEASVEAVRIVDVKLDTKYDVGIDAIKVLGCTVVADRHCPVGRAFQVPAGAFTLGSAGDQPSMEDQDGKRFHYDRTTGMLTFGMAFDGNSYSERPNRLVQLKLPVRTPT